MEYKKENRSKYLLGLIVLLAIATATTYAWEQFAITSDDQEMEVYHIVQTSTGASISSFLARPYGKNYVKITFTLAVVGVETPDLEFQILDSNGDVDTTIDGDWKITYPAAGGDPDVTDGVWSDLDEAAGAKTYYVKSTNIVTKFKGLLIVISGTPV